MHQLFRILWLTLLLVCLVTALAACKDESGELGDETTTEATSGSTTETPSGTTAPAPQPSFTITFRDEAQNIVGTMQTAPGGAYALTATFAAREGYATAGFFAADGVTTFAAEGTLSADTTVMVKYTLLETTTFAELATRAAAGVDRIFVTADIALTGPVYVVGETTIYVEKNCTLTRDASYLGDLFVVGETADGKDVVVETGNPAKLTMRAADDCLLTIDGNKANITETVKGSAFLVVHSATLTLGDGVVVQNCKKTGNEKALNYVISNAYKAGGAAIMVVNGTAILDGATLRANEANTEDAVSGDTTVGVSSCGGAIFNYGTVRLSNATLTSNQAARGGAIYNYRTCIMESAQITQNTATVYGGALYTAASQLGETLIGRETVAGETTFAVTFAENTARLSGGAIFSQTDNVLLIYGATLFEQNRSTEGNGGAINSAGTLTIFDAAFRGNVAASKGGALYLYRADATLQTRLTRIDAGLFTGNQAPRGGAIAISAAETTFPNGAIVTIGAVTFRENTSYTTATETPTLPEDADGTGTEYGHGGAIYVSRKSTLTVNGATFVENVSANKGGALYVTGESTATFGTGTSLTGNTSAGNGGAMYIYDGGTLLLTGVTFSQNVSTATFSGSYGGGALYFSGATGTAKNTVFVQNSTGGNGGAIALYSAATLTAEDCTFDRNTATLVGGAIYTNDSTLTVTDTAVRTTGTATFAANKTTGSTSSDKGGAIYATGSTVNITRATFTANEAATTGGAISAHSSSQVTLVDVVCTENIAGDNGGALAVYSSATMRLTGCTLTGNSATAHGGAVYANKATLMLSLCTATGNTATKNGGALYLTTNSVTTIQGGLYQNNTGKGGGAIYATSAASLTITDATFQSNSASGGNGGALYLYTESQTTATGVSFISNTATGKYGGAIYLSNGDGTSADTAATLKLYTVTATGNSAANGGFLYLTTSDTKLYFYSATELSDNTAPTGGNFLWCNAASAVANITAEVQAMYEPTDIGIKSGITWSVTTLETGE